MKESSSSVNFLSKIFVKSGSEGFGLFFHLLNLAIVAVGRASKSSLESRDIQRSSSMLASSHVFFFRSFAEILSLLVMKGCLCF